MDSQPDPNYDDSSNGNQKNIWPTLCNKDPKDCSDACAGPVLLEGSIDGKYRPENSLPEPAALANGEWAVYAASVNTADHKLFRTYFNGYKGYTLEPRGHLKNAPLCVNDAIDRFNAKQPKGKRYRARRAIVPGIAELCRLNPLQCQVCCIRVANDKAMDEHMRWHLTGRCLRK